ncbi:MAG: NYN domain-containing protein [Moraxellaceae bacterium]|nr:NYN domain-containing protein [Moraxellaceae bacterium]
MANPAEHGASLAVLIDADNANATIVEGLLTEVAKLGVASVKRIYGDWTTPNLSPWKPLLLEHSIHPIQQFRYTTGKNATDSAMIIDAMDLLYSGNFDGFCIVSSDSDFTRLASRIRESGKSVYGFGEKKTPRPFVSACDRFIYTEIFAEKKADTASTVKITTKQLRQDTKLTALIRSAIEASSDESGWANLGPVGSNIVKQAPDFDPRNYGYGKLSELIAAIGLFKTERVDKHIRLKDERPK